MSEIHILVANVLFSPFSYGGATIVAEQVSEALIQQGAYRVSAVSLCARSDLAAYSVIKAHKNGVDNYLINVPTHRKYAEMYQNGEVTMRLAELIHALQPDLVHAHCIQEIGTGIITAAEAANIPVILSVHDFWWLCERQFMIRPDERYCGQNPVSIEQCKGCVENFWAAKVRSEHLFEIGAKAACVTYPSQFARALSEASGFVPGKGVVWENGVQLPGADFVRKQKERRLRDRRVTFGYLGAPAQIKGWPQIQQAFRRIQRQDFRGLVVEGSLDQSWWQQRDLRGMAGDWSIFPRFSQTQMDDFYAEIDVLLFMSQWKETFGLAIREALARGIEVIQTDSGGTTEHAAAEPGTLIPIGAPAQILQGRIEGILAQNERPGARWPVTSFDEQARAFCGIVEQVMGAYERAA